MLVVLLYFYTTWSLWTTQLHSAWGVDLGRTEPSKSLIIPHWNDVNKNLCFCVYLRVMWEIIVESLVFPTVPTYSQLEKPGWNVCVAKVILLQSSMWMQNSAVCMKFQNAFCLLKGQTKSKSRALYYTKKILKLIKNSSDIHKLLKKIINVCQEWKPQM